MKFHSLLAIPAVIAFALASTSLAAQDKPVSSTPGKPASVAKQGKPAAIPATSAQGVAGKALNQGTSKQITPASTRMPTMERDHEGCHGKDMDA